MKYFFLTEGWTVGRIWGFGGLWDELGWRREPHLQRLNLCIQEQGETLWLYQVEDAVLMLEVKPTEAIRNEAGRTIGQVVLKRLMTAEQVLEQLCKSDVQVASHRSGSTD
ncbi:MAG: hypothetical protein ACTS2F_09270 [Thainema sp.]